MKEDNYNNSLLSLACMKPPGISDKMTRMLLSHPKIKFGISELKNAVLFGNTTVAHMLLDPKYHDIQINHDYGNDNDNAIEKIENLSKYHNGCNVSKNNDLLEELLYEPEGMFSISHMFSKKKVLNFYVCLLKF